MKRLIFVIVASLMVMGCRYTVTEPNVREASNPIIVVDKNTLDSCEYYPYYGHKGNCRFCAERRKQELKELVEQLKEK